MKALKYLFILLLVVIIAGAVYFSLQDGHFEVKKTATIEAPPSLVFEQLENLKNWENWNHTNLNPDNTISYGSLTTGIDANYSYQNDSGDGAVTITKLDPNKSLEYNRTVDHRLGTMETTSRYQLQESETGSQLTLFTEGDLSLGDKVWNAISGNDPAAELEAAYAKDLERLNQYLQSEMAKYTVNVDGLLDYSGGFYLYMSSSSSLENLPKLQTQMMRKLRSYMEENNIDSYGPPMVIYEKFDEQRENVIFSAGIPVKDRVLTAVNSTILCGFQEPGNAVKVTLKGAYKNLDEAWKAGEDFILVNGLQKTEQPPFEFYKTDPLKTPNPANYITELYIPVL